ncbi:hypothetical protein U27_05204 [Candidatus Vecturithrix granuli]|uniref:Uncharacterized protein n=1 Tax=Vecturithrix granuli TaxID=1499967 RepID=A0A081C0X6_VECG1|nr:hypothetical protein U27_05204 [Candidatus Vecturithrix granuli]
MIFLCVLVVSTLQVLLTIAGWGVYLTLLREHSSGIVANILSWHGWDMGGAIWGVVFIFFPFYIKKYIVIKRESEYKKSFHSEKG